MPSRQDAGSADRNSGRPPQPQAAKTTPPPPPRGRRRRRAAPPPCAAPCASCCCGVARAVRARRSRRPGEGQGCAGAARGARSPRSAWPGRCPPLSRLSRRCLPSARHQTPCHTRRRRRHYQHHLRQQRWPAAPESLPLLVQPREVHPGQIVVLLQQLLEGLLQRLRRDDAVVSACRACRLPTSTGEQPTRPLASTAIDISLTRCLS